MIFEVNSSTEMNDAITQAASENKRSVVLFSAVAWCRPCQQFEPHYKRVASETDDITFIAVDIDNNPWVMEEYDVRSVPTCWLFNEEGIYDRAIKVPVGGPVFIKDIRS